MNERTDWVKSTGKATAVALVIALAAFAGCSDDPTDPGTGTGTGRLVVHLTDAPFPLDLIDSTSVTIEQIRVRLDPGGDDDAEFFTVSEEMWQVDLLELQNGVTEVIASTDLPTGIVDQVRVHTGPATIYLTDGREFDLTFPSGSSSGVKVFPEPPIEIVDGEVVDVLLDFDLSRSFQAIPAAPNHVGEIMGFHFHPVLRVSVVGTSGSVSGRVWDDHGNDDPADDTAIDGAAVTAYRAGAEIASTVSGPLGLYALLGLAPDHYQIVGTATGFEPDTIEVTIVAGVELEDQDLVLRPLPPPPAPGAADLVGM